MTFSALTGTLCTSLLYSQLYEIGKYFCQCEPTLAIYSHAEHGKQMKAVQTNIDTDKTD